MDDLELEPELRAVLSATPSPDFVRRVRRKIADAPAPSIFAGWLRPAAAITCAVAVTIVAMQREGTRDGASTAARLIPGTADTPPTTDMRDPQNVPPPSRMPGASDIRLPASSVPAASREPASATHGREQSPGQRATQTTPLEPPLPEVIVAPEDVEALRQFVASAREVRFVASFDATPAPIPWTVDEPAEHNN